MSIISSCATFILGKTTTSLIPSRKPQRQSPRDRVALGTPPVPTRRPSPLALGPEPELELEPVPPVSSKAVESVCTVDANAVGWSFFELD